MKFALFKSSFTGYNATFSPLGYSVPGGVSPVNVYEASLFLWSQVYFFLGENAVESIVPTVLGLPGRRHSRAQFCVGAGLVKLIKTSSGRGHLREHFAS